MIKSFFVYIYNTITAISNKFYIWINGFRSGAKPETKPETKSQTEPESKSIELPKKNILTFTGGNNINIFKRNSETAIGLKTIYGLTDYIRAHGKNPSESAIAKPYLGMNFPLVPVIHPYAPNGSEELELQNRNFGMPKFFMVFSLSGINVSSIIKNQFNIDIQENACDAYMVVQSNPWSNEEVLLFRPHNWLVPDAPAAVKVGEHYGRGFEGLRVAFAYENNNVKSLENIETCETSLHPGIEVQGSQPIVFSGANMSLEKENTDPMQNHCINSLCLNDSGSAPKRAVLTCHILLDERNEQILENALGYLDTNSVNKSVTISDVLQGLKNTKFNPKILDYMTEYLSGTTLFPHGNHSSTLVLKI